MSDTITVGELLVRALRMEGVDFMCGIVDGALFDLEAELAEIFDRPVDLLPRESVHRLIRDAVFAEAEVVYAA